MNTIVKGDELMLFYQGKSIALATAHTLTLTGNTIDVSSKDHGYWGASEVGNLTWEVSTDNLYSTTEFDNLWTLFIGKTPVEIVFGASADYDTNGLDHTSKESWAPATTGVLKGKAVITSLTVNANTGENATFSATFTGTSPLVKQAGA